MQKFIKHTGIVAAMDRSNVDTDQIIPKQFLKRIERTGFGKFLFFDWRFDDAGNPNPEFELNRPEFAGATILLARKNFGNGSSREHAVWALDDFGFRCVIAESFADIFYNNCSKNGVLPVILSEAEINDLHQRVAENPGYQVSVDLKQKIVSGDGQFVARFEIDDYRRECFLEGLDHIALTLKHVDKISAWENRSKSM